MEKRTEESKKNADVSRTRIHRVYVEKTKQEDEKKPHGGRLGLHEEREK